MTRRQWGQQGRGPSSRDKSILGGGGTLSLMCWLDPKSGTLSRTLA